MGGYISEWVPVVPIQYRCRNVRDPLPVLLDCLYSHSYNVRGIEFGRFLLYTILLAVPSCEKVSFVLWCVHTAACLLRLTQTPFFLTDH